MDERSLIKFLGWPPNEQFGGGVYIERIVSAPHISTLYKHAGNRPWKIIDNDGNREKGEWIMKTVLAPALVGGGRRLGHC